MNWLTYLMPSAPKTLVYMLQLMEYRSDRFITWWLHIPNVLKVQRRQQLDLTARAKLTLLVSYGLWLVGLASGVILSLWLGNWLWLASSLSAPLFQVIGLSVFNTLFGRLAVAPTEKREIIAAKNKLSTLSAQRIAIIGSYGKTTMKDILATVLSQGLKTAATPGNKNVLISHARWVSQLSGEENVLIFEYGEAAPGDISKLARFSEPQWAIVTGLAPAHLEDYKTVEAVAKDFQTISKVMGDENIFINAQSPDLTKYFPHAQQYDSQVVDGWAISKISVSISGLEFCMSKGKQTLNLSSKLLGRHNIGPLSAAVAIAARLGLKDEEIERGVAATKPFEHRMQPYQIGGAWVIDDTYNGNLEGMKAGLKLLQELPASRKIYATPGLVEQGMLHEQVHQELGQAIAETKPDKVVLMQNSTTKHIRAGLLAGKYHGEVIIEDNPLEFYTNLEHHIAAGDLVMLQNDWPDSYR